MYKLLKRDGNAKRGEFHTVHGVIQTPVFMNVGTAAAIKGAVAAEDLKQIKTQVELSNTYHLHVRPGDKIVKKMGGIHKFMNWDKPILTDSGGIQEEAPSFACPTLVMRYETERKEGIDAGVSKLVGADYDKILEESEKILSSTKEATRLKAQNPYGDGTASKQIEQIIRKS